MFLYLKSLHGQGVTNRFWRHVRSRTRNSLPLYVHVLLKNGLSTLTIMLFSTHFQGFSTLSEKSNTCFFTINKYLKSLIVVIRMRVRGTFVLRTFLHVQILQVNTCTLHYFLYLHVLQNLNWLVRERTFNKNLMNVKSKININGVRNVRNVRTYAICQPLILEFVVSFILEK